jgi:predicted ferric reductase
MTLFGRLSTPLLVVFCAAVPVYWAFPEDLPPARSLGIVVGWAGCGLLLASLLLMLRETWLARWLGGLETMYRWHHWSGMAAYVLLLVHPLALAVDAWPESPRLAWQTLSPFSQAWPIWLGWLALLLLMLGLAATFSPRLAYRSWRRLHFALGLGVLCGLGHLLLLGIDEPVLPLLALATLFLGWRLLGEDSARAARPYVVGASARMADDVVEISLSPLAQPVAAGAGQFVLVAFFSGAGFRACGEFHPFTVSAIDADGRLRIAVKALGDCTRRIQSVGPGVPARVHGAFGSFLADRQPTPQLWLAGGIGITPFLALLRSARLSQPTTLLYLYRSEADAAFVPELQALAAADRQLSLYTLATGDEPPNVDLLLAEAGAPAAGLECYLCGPPGMLAAVRQALRRRGISPRHIHFERFGFR